MLTRIAIALFMLKAPFLLTSCGQPESGTDVGEQIRKEMVAADEASAGSVIGTYLSANDNAVTLEADGNCFLRLDGEANKGTYTVSGDKIIIESDNYNGQAVVTKGLLTLESRPDVFTKNVSR